MSSSHRCDSSLIQRWVDISVEKYFSLFNFKTIIVLHVEILKFNYVELSFQ